MLYSSLQYRLHAAPVRSPPASLPGRPRGEGRRSRHCAALRLTKSAALLSRLTLAALLAVLPVALASAAFGQAPVATRVWTPGALGPPPAATAQRPALRGEAIILPLQRALLTAGRLQPVGRTCQLRQPAPNGGYVYWPSPDGRRVAYLWGPINDERILVADLARGTTAAVGRAEGYFHAGWSPDGHRLCALRNRASSGGFRVLSLIDAVTGAERKVAECVAWARFSLDGRALVLAKLYTHGHLAAHADYGKTVGERARYRARYYVSAPLGAAPRSLPASGVDRLLGGAWLRALAVLRPYHDGMEYFSDVIEPVVSPGGDQALVSQLEPPPFQDADEPLGVEDVGRWHHPQEFGLVDAAGRLRRVRPSGERRPTRWPDSYRPVGWSADGRTIYLMQGKGGWEEEVLLAAMDARTGRVLGRQRLRRTDGVPVALVALRPH